MFQCFRYLSMLGCDSRFMSWTSLSMLALLLARMFIFRAMTWPDTRCCTWITQNKKNSFILIHWQRIHAESISKLQINRPVSVLCCKISLAFFIFFISALTDSWQLLRNLLENISQHTWIHRLHMYVKTSLQNREILTLKCYGDWPIKH